MKRRGFLTGLGAMAVAAVVMTGVLTTGVAPAWAQSLDQLRAEGVIAERYDGLVEIRQGGGGGASSIVDQVNAQRRDIYQKRADEQGVSADAVGRVYAKQIFEKAPAGTYFKQENGSYIKK